MNLRWLKHTARFVVVTVGIIALTSFTIDATDALRGSQSALSILTKEVLTGDCPIHMTRVDSGDKSFCIDVYENSPSESCRHKDPASPQDSSENVAGLECRAHSEPDVLPWRFVTFTQAQQLCARDGKRLPTNAEWYAAVSGITADTCTTKSTNGQPVVTGSSACTSPLGTHDMVGNVWERVDGAITNGLYEERSLPATGYVSGVDVSGVVTETSAKGQLEFGNDYAWTAIEGERVVARGGFYGSGEDAGVFAQNLSLSPDFSAAGIGFRCVSSL